MLSTSGWKRKDVHLIVDHPGLRLWRASDALMNILPDEAIAPPHTPYRATSSIDEIQPDGLHYVTCRSGVWHVDGLHLMTFVVVAGTLQLQMSYITGDQRQPYGSTDPAAPKWPDQDHWIQPEVKHDLVRGDTFVMWGIHAHRAIGAGNLALINIDCKIPICKELYYQENLFSLKKSVKPMKLFSPVFTERILTSHIKKTKLWTKYCARR